MNPMPREDTSSPRERLLRKLKKRNKKTSQNKECFLPLSPPARCDGAQRPGLHPVEQQRGEDDELQPGDQQLDPKSEPLPKVLCLIWSGLPLEDSGVADLGDLHQQRVGGALQPQQGSDEELLRREQV